MNATLAPRVANTPTIATCPLCHESPAADVATHLDGEDDAIGEPTFAMIKVLHSGWLEEHGACAACWSFYRNLVRALNATGPFDPRFRINGRTTNPDAKLNGKERFSQEA
jgi:hypothetical protein